MEYITALALAAGISFILTPVVRAYAIRNGAVDRPDARKVHRLPLPRIGGIGITVAFVVTFLIYFDLNRQFYGLLGALLVLFIVGLIDDLRELSAWQKLVAQIISACIALAGGLGIVYLAIPFGGTIALDGWRIPVELGMISFNLLPIANLVSIIWIVGMINTVNFLDGLDGLAAGVASIGAFVLFISALLPHINNPAVALLAIILLGSLLGFLPHNFYPSSIFMGDSGAYVIGLLLALLSIYSSSKIAVGAIVFGIAILDALWTVLRRIASKKSPFMADREHLHHRLLDSGLLSHREVVLVLYLLTLLVAFAVLYTSVLIASVFVIASVVATIMVLRIKAGSRNKRPKE